MEVTHNIALEDMDRQSLLHPSTNLKDHAHKVSGDPRIMVTGKGVRVVDRGGTEFIDAFAGLYCVNIGYGRTEVADAIYEQAKKLAYFHTYAGHSNEPAIRLADRILRLAPDNMSKVYFGLSGSDANETQVKLVWYYNNVVGRPRKKKIISRHRGYHGCSVISGSLTGLPIFHTAFDLPIGPILHTTTPHYYWQAEAGMSEPEFSKKCADDLDALITDEGPDTVAAFIGEPVMGTGGLIPPPEGYWQEIQTVLDKHDVLLISDEVVCGFGRLGTNFGADYYGMRPDFMTVAKGLTSAYLPLSGAIVSERVWQVLEQGSDTFGVFTHGYTYSAHPTAAAAGLANLDIVEREDLVGNARDVGAYFQERLRATFADHPIVGEARGVGLLAALEFVADKQTKERFDPGLKVGAKVSAACAGHGLLARAMPHGDILGYAPPLVLTRDDVDEIVERTGKAVDEVADGLIREGTWKAA